ncbi:LpxL/LpxP family Kdo(2)-lipid IV(A) lauroyl/palmitoleoyl acyltransferase [unidentified bacterial endosymbiont]|uniref:LpxL/LpxP family Kdo(2)-lipid IV(A) lauroyl/palmitoleoyl acyltransferase n=1 Tax=unidentified bacterial endosymbiont TaxID=2355 RepID=UPI00209DEA29|nr:LpxL/LpxP family Kdo(2)-lipid IV(A) lauroyl/palmitoleoyl acyltransferase [unidentified bacterial endosymbiont]
MQITGSQWRWQLLKPRYWGLWLGIGLLWLLVQLPYPLLYRLGRRLGRCSMRFAHRRLHITRCNLQQCFPNLTLQQQQQLLIDSFESAGLGVIECGMAWFWSNRRINQWCTLSGTDAISNLQQIQQGILLIGIHFFSLELGARVFGLRFPGIGVYRPHNNPLLEWLQVRGRLRSNKALINRKNIKGMVKQLKRGAILWYAPDHDYGPNNSVFVPFFAVKQAATTLGTHFLVRHANPAVVLFTPLRHPEGQGYSVMLQPPLATPLPADPVAATTLMNQAIETEILRAPGQYMWLHRRFKTRPVGEPCVY